jgi:hypothetical protein
MIRVPTDTADLSITIRVYDDAGLPVTGLVAATFPTVKLCSSRGADSTISLSDLAAVTSTYSSGGVKERGDGAYRLDVPTLSTADTYTIRGEATDKRVIAPLIQVAGDLDDITAAAAGGAAHEDIVNLNLDEAISEVYGQAEAAKVAAMDKIMPGLVLAARNAGMAIPFAMSQAGMSVTVTISKNGAAAAAPAGSVVEIGGGMYRLNATAADLDTAGVLVLTCTAGSEIRRYVVDVKDFDASVDADATAIATAVDSLLSANHGDGDWDASGTAGSGALPVTITLTESEDADPIQGAVCWITTDADGDNRVTGERTTDDNGQVTFNLDEGNYYFLWAKKAGRLDIAARNFRVAAGVYEEV